MAMDTPTVLTIPYVTPSEAYAAAIVLPVLGAIFVALRVYSGSLQKKSVKLDDWIIIFAEVLLIGMGVCLIIGVARHGFAYPTPRVPSLSREEMQSSVDPTLQLMGMVQYVFVLLMVLAYGTIKLSITLFYRRIFVASKGTMFDWVIIVAIVVAVVWTIAFFFGNMFACGIHISAAWSTVHDAKSYCRRPLDFSNALVVSDLVTDIIILFLPLPVIWNLHMSTGRKLVVSCILATGAVSVIASVIKVLISYEVTNAGFDAIVDPWLTISTLLYWSMIEAGLAIIAACLPTLRVLFSKVSFDTLVRNLRSALSLTSLRSQRSEPSRTQFHGPYSNLQADGSSNSHAQMVTEKNVADTYVMGNQYGVHAKGNGIQVTRQISQHDDIV